MSTSLYKLLLISVTVFLGVMSTSAQAQSNYDFSASFNGGATSISGVVDWTGILTVTGGTLGTGDATGGWNYATAPTSSNGYLAQLDFQWGAGNQYFYFQRTGSGPVIAYTNPTNASYYDIGTYPKDSTVAAPSAVFGPSGAPEIDGSLAPKVGFLLGCLFLMFGRKKQISEPMMTA